MTSQDLHTRIHNLNRILDQFWVRWRDEYLLQLRERYHITDNVGVARVPIPGEVVLVHDENHPHTMWRLGRVSELIVGADGQTRGTHLKSAQMENYPHFADQPLVLTHSRQNQSLAQMTEHLRRWF